MAFDSKFIKFGVIKIEKGNVRIYANDSHYNTINVGDAVSAVWAGDCLNVTLSNGKVRRYSNPSHYNTI